MATQSSGSYRALVLLGYAVLVLASVAGAWAALQTVLDGHVHTGATQHAPWGIWVAFYLFFLGLSGGSYLFGAVGYVAGIRRLQQAAPIAFLQALGAFLLGGILVVLDLGHPERFYKVFVSLNPTSAMAWMGVFDTVYVGILLASLYLVLRPWLVERVRRGQEPLWLYRSLSLGSQRTDPESLERDHGWLVRLSRLGIAVALAVTICEGLIFAVAKARPNWFGGLTPIFFLVLAGASGGGLLAFLIATCSRALEARKRPVLRLVSGSTAFLVALAALMVGLDILTTSYGDMPRQETGWRLALFGPYWWVFWFVQLGLGTLVPLGIILGSRTGNRVGWLGGAGFLVGLGMLGTRLNLVIPPQIAPSFPEAPAAYHSFRFTLGYFPSAHEWMVIAGVVALGIWLLLGARRLLPLELTSEALQGGE